MITEIKHRVTVSVLVIAYVKYFIYIIVCGHIIYIQGQVCPKLNVVYYLNVRNGMLYFCC